MLVAQPACPEKVAAVRIEGHAVCSIERPDKLRDGIPGKSKPPEHIVARIKQNKNAGPRSSRGNQPGPSPTANNVLPKPGYFPSGSGVSHASRNAILFTKSRNLFSNSIFKNLKVLGTQAGYIPAFAVCHRHVELDHIDGNMDNGYVGVSFLCGRPQGGAY
jgi:hypothetical protein